MSKVTLGRDQLSKFLPNHEAIRKFEKVLSDISDSMPAAIESANNAANSALANAYEAISGLIELQREVQMILVSQNSNASNDGGEFALPLTQEQAEAIERAFTEAAEKDDTRPVLPTFCYESFFQIPSPPDYGQDFLQPWRQELEQYEETFVPPVYVGSLGLQDFSNVSITGGLIDGTPVGSVTPSTGAFTIATLNAGAVGTPSLYWGTDTSTGFYRIGSNNIGLAISGTKLVDFASGAVSVAGTLATTGQQYGLRSTNGSSQTFYSYVDSAGVGVTNANTFQEMIYMDRTNVRVSVFVAGASVARFTSTGLNNCTLGATTAAAATVTSMLVTNGTRYMNVTVDSGGVQINDFNGTGFTNEGFYLDASGQNVRTYAAGSEITRASSTGLKITGVVSTTDPTSGAGPNWKLGSKKAATVALDTANYVEIDIGGTKWKLGLVV